MSFDSIQDREAAAVIQQLLDGSFNGSQPDLASLGRWADDVKILWRAHSNTHEVEDVRQAFAERTKTNPNLGALIANAPDYSALPDGDTPPLIPELPDSAKLRPGLEAGASPWLDETVEFLATWSPRAYEGFYEACAVWLLSVIAARRVVLDLGGERYPNLYVALVARTSLFAKTTTVNIVIQILQELGLDWMLAPDDATPQAFIHSLTGNIPQDYDALSAESQERVRNRIGLQGARGWYYEEFGGFIHSMLNQGGVMSDFRSHLRRLDDPRERYEYATMGRGSDVVNKPYLAFLANATPADFKPVANRGSALWGDGFLARFALVTPPVLTLNTERFPDGKRKIPGTILKHLSVWNSRLGLPVVTISDVNDSKGKPTGRKKAKIEPKIPVDCTFDKEVFDAFYNYHDGLMSILVVKSDLTDLDGNYARFAEKALRISILLASLENNNHIEMRHWAKAQQITENWRSGLHALYEQITASGISSEAELERIFLDIVRKKGSPTLREIYQNSRKLDTTTAKRIASQLLEHDIIKEEKTERTVRYSLVE